AGGLSASQGNSAYWEAPSNARGRDAHALHGYREVPRWRSETRLSALQRERANGPARGAVSLQLGDDRFRALLPDNGLRRPRAARRVDGELERHRRVRGDSDSYFGKSECSHCSASLSGREINCKRKKTGWGRGAEQPAAPSFSLKRTG